MYGNMQGMYGNIPIPQENGLHLKPPSLFFLHLIILTLNHGSITWEQNKIMGTSDLQAETGLQRQKLSNEKRFQEGDTGKGR